MKYHPLFEERIGCPDAESVFGYFMKHLKDTIKGWDFFVSWEKVMGNVEEMEISLNILNSLVGKENIREAFEALLFRYPEVAQILPVLLAIREKSIKVLEPNHRNIFNFKEYSFEKKKFLEKEEIASMADFAENSGIFDLFQNRRVRNIVDYVMGVEVGLDSNARKNRTGDAMEHISRLLIHEICHKWGFQYMIQANASRIRQQFGYEVKVDKSERSFDFAIDTGNKLYLLETNYYGGGGSKLKSVAGEFSSLFSFLQEVTPQHGFIWITDGKGWETTTKPLKEAFDKIDFILNFTMLENGILEAILTKGC